MKKVLYLSNIEIPYRVRFFNELAKHCDLTVLYERASSGNRDKIWASSEKRDFKVGYLNGISISNEQAFSFGIFKYILRNFDCIIVGCYNSPVQAMAIAAMRVLRIPYFLNVDGEVFIKGNSLKVRLKKWFLTGATGYLAAGEKSASSLARVAGNVVVTAYHFSSLTEKELEQNRIQVQNELRNGKILVVGQFFDYKGMDIALEAAKMDTSISYQFVGMGKRSELFRQRYNVDEIPNVEVIPFLQKKEMERAYRSCALLLLPSRQECWGLVINEAASFGTPVVSTWGSGAAVEFLADTYPQYLAEPCDVQSLLKCIRSLLQEQDTTAYGQFLMEKSAAYSIEKSVAAHLHACGIEMKESE